MEKLFKKPMKKYLKNKLKKCNQKNLLKKNFIRKKIGSKILFKKKNLKNKKN